MVKSGCHEIWYENGSKFISNSYSRNYLHGVCEMWHPNGNLKKRKYYIYKKKTGLHEKWSVDGQITSRCIFRKGICQGLNESWYDNGRRKYRYTFSSDRQCYDGVYEEWTEDGVRNCKFLDKGKEVSHEEFIQSRPSVRKVFKHWYLKMLEKQTRPGGMYFKRDMEAMGFTDEQIEEYVQEHQSKQQ